VENMDEIKNLESKLATLQAELDKIQGTLSEKVKAIESLTGENTELKTQFAKAEKSKKESELRAALDSAVTEGKIVPAQIKYFMAVAMNEDGIKTYSFNEGEKSENIEGERIDLIKKIVENAGKVPMGEASVKGDVEMETYSKKDTEFDDEDLDKKASEYAEKNGVTYKEAFKKIVMEGK
jgi:regulator of replication initiation timing